MSDEDEKPTKEDLDACLQFMVSNGYAIVENVNGEDIYELTPKGLEYYQKQLAEEKDNE